MYIIVHSQHQCLLLWPSQSFCMTSKFFNYFAISRYGPARSLKNAAYVKRDTFGMDNSDGFSLTAQSIRMPALNLRNFSIDATGFGQTQSLLRPRPEMKKSTSQVSITILVESSLNIKFKSSKFIPYVAGYL